MEIMTIVETILKRKQLFIAVFLVVLAVTLGIILSVPETYTSCAKVSVTLPQGEDELSAAEQAGFIDGEIAVIRDNAVVNEVIRELDLRDGSGNFLGASDLLSRVKISVLKDTDIIQIKAEGQTPDMSADIANSFARNFIRWRYKLGKMQYGLYGAYIDEKTANLKKNQSENAKKLASEMKKAKGRQLSADEQARIDKEASVEIEKEKIDMQIKKNLTAAGVPEQNRSTLKDRQKVLLGVTEKFRRETADSQFNALITAKKDEKVFNSLYAMLSQERDKIMLGRATQQGDARIISPASESNAVKSAKRPGGFLAGALAGLMLSACAVFLPEYLDHAVAGTGEASDALKLALLYGDKVPASVLRDREGSMFGPLAKDMIPSDIFPGLYGALRSTMKAGDAEIFSFISSKEEKARSLAVFSLARKAASSGRRALVIDAAPKHSLLQRLFSAHSEAGIAEAACGEKPVDEVIIATKYENIFYLGSGDMSREAGETQFGEKITSCIAGLGAKYDCIYIDLPFEKESFAFSAFIRAAGASVPVVLGSVTKRPVLADMKEVLHKLGAKTPGFVFISESRV